jgi:hypothetical protein
MNNAEEEEEVGALLALSVFTTILFDEWRLRPNDSMFAIDALCTLIETVDESAESNSEQEVRGFILSTGGIQVILQCLETHRQHLDVQKAGFVLLTSLTNTNENMEVLVEAGCIQHILAGMEAHSADAYVQWTAIVVLQCLACWEDTTRRDTIASHGGAITLIVTAMQAHPNEAELQLAACALFAVLTKNNARNQRLIGETDAIEAIVPAMRVVFACDDLVAREGFYAGCAALHHLANHEPNKIKIANADGISLLIDAMSKGQEFLRPQLDCCGALSYLATNDNLRATIVAKGGIPLVITAMDTFLYNEQVQQAGLNTLGSFARDSRSNVVRIRFSGGMNSIHNASEEHSDHSQIQASIVGTLYRFAQACVEELHGSRAEEQES